MIKVSYTLVIYLTISFGHPCISSAQQFVLSDEHIVNVNRSGAVQLMSPEGQQLKTLRLDGDFMHCFLVGKKLLSVQTSDYTYTINTDELSIEEKLTIPEDLKTAEYYYYFKRDSLTFEINISSKYYSLKYYQQKSRPLKLLSSSYTQNLIKKERRHQAVWDLHNQTFYFNLPHSSEFYVINLAENKMKNVRASSKLAIAAIEGIYWYADSKNDQIYLFGANTKNQVGKLFSFPDGLPEPKETWMSGGVKMSRDDTTWEDHNLLVDKIAYLPRYVHNGKWVK